MDGIFHLAGFISTRKRDRQRIYRENFEATKALWDALLRVRFPGKIVYLASIFALAGGEEIPVDENTPYNLEDAPVEYFRAKRKAELETLTIVQAGDLAITFVYPTFCLGPGDLRLSSSRLLWLYLNMPIPVGFSGGWNILDVRDAVSGLMLGWEKGEPGEKTILAGRNVTFAETFILLDKLTGLGQPWIYFGGKSLHLLGKLLERIRFPYLDTATIWISSRFWYYTGKKAEEEWGFKVRPLEETLKDAILFFLERNMIRSPGRKNLLAKRLLGEKPLE
jgi:dihydroflavonol-4-reductase